MERFWRNTNAILDKFEKKADERKLIFNINIENSWNLFLKQDRKCALSGIELNFKNVNGKEYATASLDRIDSKIGYIENNIQWIHKDLNIIKWDFTEQELLNWIEKIYLYRINK